MGHEAGVCTENMHGQDTVVELFKLTESNRRKSTNLRMNFDALRREEAEMIYTSQLKGNYFHLMFKYFQFRGIRVWQTCID